MIEYELLDLKNKFCNARNWYITIICSPMTSHQTISYGIIHPLRKWKGYTVFFVCLSVLLFFIKFKTKFRQKFPRTFLLHILWILTPPLFRHVVCTHFFLLEERQLLVNAEFVYFVPKFSNIFSVTIYRSCLKL